MPGWPEVPIAGVKAVEGSARSCWGLGLQRGSKALPCPSQGETLVVLAGGVDQVSQPRRCGERPKDGD